MSFPVGPWLPVLMIAQTGLSQQSWAGELPPIASGQTFWASSRDVPGLVAASLAAYAPTGTTAPPVEPAYTARGTPGFAAGTSNSSYPGPPVIPFDIDGGRASGSSPFTISGGTSAGTGTGDIDGGDS
jgi:hypothetical protein